MHPTPRLAAALLAGGLGWRCSPRPTWSRTATPASNCAIYFNRDFRQSGATVRSNFANDLDEIA